MANKITKIPQIRFNDFTGDWEQRKLKEYIIPYTEKTTLNNQYPVLTSSRKGLFLQTDYYKGNQIASDDNTGYNIVPRNYFTYRHMSDDEIFKFNINDLVDFGIVSTLYPVFTTNVEMDSIFLQYILNFGSEFSKFAIMQKQGGSRTYMYLSKLEKLQLTLPKFEEQQKIGSFFKQLDNTIALHHQKLEGIQLYKKSMLQKMFPKNGEKAPEIRFEGFTEDWEQRKLGEVADIVGGGTPSTTNDDYWSGGDIDWYAPAEIGNQIFINKSKKKITELGLEKSSAKVLPIGTILFTSRAGIGNTAILSKEGSTNQGFQSIVPHKDVLDSYFIFSRTNELKRYGEVTGAGSTFIEVSGKQMAKMLMLIPKFEEQTKIGNFFKQLDDTITLQERKLEFLKQMKKSLLQKMFV